ncbi:MAG: polysaccharide deacetylase family protein [Oscillospiraceae bacterium]|nr:polysaccharide deacetylase family protein [Oscillospiraceae bacterium]
MENNIPEMEPIASGETHRTERSASAQRRLPRKRRRQNRTLKIINAVLLLLAGLGLAACAFAGYRYYTFSPGTYDDQIAALHEEAARIRTETEALQQELALEDEQMRSDLHQAGEEGAAAADALSTAKAENESLTETHTALVERVDFIKNIHENAQTFREEYARKIRQLEDMIVAGESGAKICYWSFDDGPGSYTAAVLDFCEQNGIYVTFFTSREANDTGRGDVDEPELLRREIMGGHSIQNHSNSHQYSMIAGNMYTKGIDSFREQVRLQDEWVYENTGFKPGIFRFPGGSAHAFSGPLSKDQMVSVLTELGYVWIDWDCDMADNAKANPDAGTVYSRAMYQVRKIDPPIAVVLSHDNYYSTYAGFMRAVPALQAEGYIFLPLFPESYAIGHSYARTWYY